MCFFGILCFPVTILSMLMTVWTNTVLLVTVYGHIRCFPWEHYCFLNRVYAIGVCYVFFEMEIVILEVFKRMSWGFRVIPYPIRNFYGCRECLGWIPSFYSCFPWMSGIFKNQNLLLYVASCNKDGKWDEINFSRLSFPHIFRENNTSRHPSQESSGVSIWYIEVN